MVYTRIMKHIVATSPVKPKTKDSALAAQVYAGILVVVEVVWLLGFDRFVAALDSYGLPGWNGGLVAAICLSLFGIFALPFLLQMKLSPAMRFVSMVSSWLMVALWLTLSVWSTVFSDQIPSVALVAPVLELPPGWWMITLATGIGILCVWSTWGLWPYGHRSSLETARKK